LSVSLVWPHLYKGTDYPTDPPLAAATTLKNRSCACRDKKYQGKEEKRDLMGEVHPIYTTVLVWLEGCLKF